MDAVPEDVMKAEPHIASMQREIERLRDVIENALQAYAETHDSDEARCRAMAAMLSDYRPAAIRNPTP